MTEEEVQRQERIREIRARLGPMKAGMPKSVFDKLPAEIKMYARCEEGVSRAMPRLPRTIKQAATLLTLNEYFNLQEEAE